MHQLFILLSPHFCPSIFQAFYFYEMINYKPLPCNSQIEFPLPGVYFEVGGRFYINAKITICHLR